MPLFNCYHENQRKAAYTAHTVTTCAVDLCSSHILSDLFGEQYDDKRKLIAFKRNSYVIIYKHHYTTADFILWPMLLSLTLHDHSRVNEKKNRKLRLCTLQNEHGKRFNHGLKVF